MQRPAAQNWPRGHWLSVMQPFGLGMQTPRIGSQVVPAGHVAPFAPQPETHAPLMQGWPLQSIDDWHCDGVRQTFVLGSHT